MVKTSIKFVNHASVLIKSNNISLLSDPWYTGNAFHKGWNLLCETSSNDIKSILNEVTHIWISHEHPDHFSIEFFKIFINQIKERNILILFQNTNDKRVINFLKHLGLKYQELDFEKPFFLSQKFSVTCIKDGFYDSGLLVNNDGEKILNLNDCEIKSKKRAKEVYSITGKIDVLLTQFSYAAWKGGENNKRWRMEAAQEKLNAIEIQIKSLKPKYVIPFASFIYFSNIKNFYLNDLANKPEDVYNGLPQFKSKFVFMKPMDQLGGKYEKLNRDLAFKFWKEKYELIRSKKLNTYEKIPMDQIEKSFIKYSNRISKKNNMWLIKLLRFLSPISVFKPIIIKINDLNYNVKFDYVDKYIKKVEDPPFLSMESESLYFLFENTFGYDTLTVNGCFKEETQGGFINATKTLAIENLNNLGIKVEIKTLFNFFVIKLFLSRLYRVARKLEA